MDLKTAATAAIVTVLSSAPSSATDASACYTIADADGRALCLARARKDPGTCYTIQQPGLRSRCLAEVRK